MAKCVCGSSPANTGQGKCKDIIKVGRRLIFVKLLADDGTENVLANDAAVTKSALQAKFDETDASKRFYPMPIMENVNSERAESVFEEFESGIRSLVRRSPRTFSGIVSKAPAYFDSIAEGWGCIPFGVYIIDDEGTFIGRRVKDTAAIKPIPVVETSLVSTYNWGTNANGSSVLMNFDFAKSFKDEELYAIADTSLDFDGLSTVDVYGLLDVAKTNKGADIYSSITATTFDVDLVDYYGSPIRGVVVGDVKVWNATTSTELTPTGCVESATVKGRYTITIAAQTAGDDLNVRLTKSGYDGSLLNETMFDAV